MITHVGQAGEGRGRVVLWLGAAGEPQETAVEAAFRIAQAYESEVESIFIEDRQLYDLAALPFSQEISLSGRRRPLTPDLMAAEMRAQSSLAQRRIKTLALTVDVRTQTRVIREEPVKALAKACAENGPWNVVAIGTPYRRSNGANLSELFENVHATTGFVVAGPQARRTSGPVVAIVEELDRVVPMLRAAERLAATTAHGDVRLWLADDDLDRLEWMEGQARLMLANTPEIALRTIDLFRHNAHAVAELLRDDGAGFVLARFGGLFVPDEADAGPIAEMLDGPLFLVR
jgi:hypothetical protein